MTIRTYINRLIFNLKSIYLSRTMKLTIISWDGCEFGFRCSDDGDVGNTVMVIDNFMYEIKDVNK